MEGRASYPYVCSTKPLLYHGFLQMQWEGDTKKVPFQEVGGWLVTLRCLNN